MKTNVTQVLDKLPDGKGTIVVLSGGMDSTIAMRLCVEKYGKENVHALTFYYGQRQVDEIVQATKAIAFLGIKHKILDLRVLGQLGQGFSANVDTNIIMPTIEEVLGDPRPKTYVPNRNMVFMSIAAAYAEVQDLPYIVMGLQVHDEYGYHDTTQSFVNKINDVLAENRMIKIKVIAPFAQLSKYDEIIVLKELDGNVDLLKFTLTCYNPGTIHGESCGLCPSCSERIANFAKAGMQDPISYSIDIPWERLIEEHKVCVP